MYTYFLYRVWWVPYTRKVVFDKYFGVTCCCVIHVSYCILCFDIVPYNFYAPIRIATVMANILFRALRYSTKQHYYQRTIWAGALRVRPSWTHNSCHDDIIKKKLWNYYFNFNFSTLDLRDHHQVNGVIVLNTLYRYIIYIIISQPALPPLPRWRDK